MSQPTAKTILRSRNASAPQHVLSTLLVRMPRIILAEWNTHRIFSRNAASTRAIPTKKLIEQVATDPFVPLVWGKNVPGMQSVGIHEDVAACELAWLKARDAAVENAERLMDLGLHKQIVGRVLEPWMWTLVCVSSTEWNNFRELRDHEAAEPHIQMLAKEIGKCLDDESTIQTINPGAWHTPFVTDEDDPYDQLTIDQWIKLSVARCASTSYKTVDGFDMTLERAVALHDKLVGSKPLHASPCEHVAMADNLVTNGPYLMPWFEHRNQHANFTGFRQYRHMLGETA